MDKRFRNLILAQVESVVHDKPPGRDSLYDLLKIATPELKVHAVDNTSQRESAYRSLKILIHPDKHARALRNEPNELRRVTKVFQETSAYYNACCARLAMESPGMSSNNSLGETTMRTNDHTGFNNDYTTKSPRTKSPHRDYDRRPSNISNKRDFRPPSVIRVDSVRQSGSKLPAEFDAYQMWPFMTSMVKGPDNPDGGASIHELAWIMACRAINLRGAVIHGQAIGRAYQVSKKSNELDKYKAVDEVLKHFGFVCRSQLRQIEDIKAEIYEHGPVVSTSFHLSKAFYSSTPEAHKFSHRQVSKAHPLIITGWSMASHGEMWCVQALTGEPFEIGTGQFDISKTVLAVPTHILETIPWQSQGPYLDLNMPSVGGGVSKDWRDLRHMSISISAEELETLVSLLDGGFQKAIQSKQSFVVRDKKKKAYSRRYTLREVTTGDKGKWKISISLAEKTDD